MSELDRYADLLQPLARSLYRARLGYALAPMWATAEQKAVARAQVTAYTDDEIDAMMDEWLTEVSKFCPECGQPYELSIATLEEREAALAAIHAYDVAHGRVVPLPGYDHVHRVTPDEQGTGA